MSTLPGNLMRRVPGYNPWRSSPHAAASFARAHKFHPDDFEDAYCSFAGLMQQADPITLEMRCRLWRLVGESSDPGAALMKWYGLNTTGDTGGCA